MGADSDYLLNLNTDNCPAFGKAINDNWSTFEKSIQTKFSKFLTTLNGYLGKTADVKTALDFCAYI